jgi:endogenous inhibitor of DNA gyrase (YacG/DUF329 family)
VFAVLIDQLLLKPAETILDSIAEMVDQQAAREGVKVEKAAPSRVRCPGCGSPVLREELLDKGCYVCGWSPPPHSSPYQGEEVRKGMQEQKVEQASFRVACPGCGTTVVREQLVESGCYVCGWRPADEDGV